jgi:hypothetical protein
MMPSETVRQVLESIRDRLSSGAAAAGFSAAGMRIEDAAGLVKGLASRRASVAIFPYRATVEGTLRNAAARASAPSKGVSSLPIAVRFLLIGRGGSDPAADGAERGLPRPNGLARLTPGVLGGGRDASSDFVNQAKPTAHLGRARSFGVSHGVAAR